MRRQQETRRIIVHGDDGRTYTAIELTTMIGGTYDGRTQWAPGTRDWRLSDGRPLNTDDDIEFSDLDGGTYRLRE